MKKVIFKVKSTKGETKESLLVSDFYAENGFPQAVNSCEDYRIKEALKALVGTKQIFWFELA